MIRPLLASLLLAATAPAALAQGWQRPPAVIPGVATRYVPLGPGVPGVLYEPTRPGPKARIALFVMHASGDYLTFSACSELAKRGYRVLCANNSTSKSGAFDDGVFDRVLTEAGFGVQWLRDQPGIDTIVLFGHSGGATIMTAYQAIAEGGTAFCRNPALIHRCPDALANLPRADGVVLADANWGQAEMTLLSADPAVIDDRVGTRLDPALDMYAPANGYRPTGSAYAPSFVARFQRAAAARWRGIVAKAQARMTAIAAGRGDYVDDEPFVVAGASFIGNRLFTEDTRLLARSRQPWPLLHGDGSVTTEIIRSLRTATGRTNPSPTYGRGALKTTVASFLSTYAIRVTPGFGYDATHVYGVDWTSTYASPPGNVEAMSVPLLTMGMTGNWEGLAAEEIHLHARSKDRTIAFVEGATHVYTPCTTCVLPAARFGDTIRTTYDYIDRWLAKPGRFGKGS